MTFTQNINISYFEHKRKSYLTNFSVELRSDFWVHVLTLTLTLSGTWSGNLSLLKHDIPLITTL